MDTFLKLIKSTQPRMLTSIRLACTRISATSIPLRSLSGTAVAHGISEDEIAAARKAWGDALVSISTAYDESGIEKATELAEGALDGAYGYNLGPVLFKPTLASGEKTFRPTRDGALAYFVEGDVAMWMGWVTFTDKDGGVTKVDKSWGYKKDDQGNLRIVLHHSSLPYQP